MDSPSLFSAVSSSTRQLHTLLRCLGFGDKAIVQISDKGIRFTVHESSIMEGNVFLQKALFTSYQLAIDPEDDGTDLPLFQVSLPSIVEALQLFGVSESARNPWDRDAYTGDGAFSAQTLGVSSICRFRYDSVGSPLIIVLEETGLTTKCELVTYVLDTTPEIPFDRVEIDLKVIMDASFLQDAITELASGNPTKIIFGATPNAFILSAPSDIGSALVQFDRQSSEVSAAEGTDPDQGILETFNLASDSCHQAYKFSHVSSTRRAFGCASKVSIRIDTQGVLNFQFLVENLENQQKSFVDYKLVPIVLDDEDGDHGFSDGESKDY